MTFKTQFHIWSHGDRTVGDGTFVADVEIEHLLPENLSLAREVLTDAFAKIWDARPSLVHVMTDLEFRLMQEQVE
jgi:hypothetical protein